MAFERPVKTDHTTRHEYRFAGGFEPKTLVMHNAHASTDVFVRLAADDGSTVPSDAYFDIMLKAGGSGDDLVIIPNISVQVLVVNPVDEIAIFRY